MLSQVFRVFYSSIAILPETFVDLVLVACLISFNAEETIPHNMRSLNRAGGFGSRTGFEIGDQLTNFFN